MKSPQVLGPCLLFLLLDLFLLPVLLAGATGENSALEPVSGSQKTESVDVLYTGRMMGYFRIPNWQSGADGPSENGSHPCARWTQDRWSEEARQFDKQRQREPNAILVGTGDNFAPEIEARDFWPPPTPMNETTKRDETKKPPVGRDQYYWYPNLRDSDKDSNGSPIIGGDGQPITNRWISAEDADKFNLNKLDAILSNGWGTIPMDNVGCFLIREGFAAVVPGRHDFYFGPERLREIARFLASNPIPEQASVGPLWVPTHAHYVQMLGANLVIETTSKKSQQTQVDPEAKLGFVPRWPDKFQNSKDSNSKDFPRLLWPAANGKAYPWLPAVRLQIALNHESLDQFQHQRFDTLEHLVEHLQSAKTGKSEGEIERLQKTIKQINEMTGLLGQDQIKLCESAKPGNPNAILPKGSDCQLLSGKNKQPPCLSTTPGLGSPERPYFAIADGAVEYVLPLPNLCEGRFQKFFTLQPGENYGLCLSGANLPKSESTPKRDIYYCQRFSVYWPFFSFHSDLKQPPVEFNEPEPYVFIEKDEKLGRPPVAIFGIVDPTVEEYVGALNLTWQNKNKECKTSVAINDPVEALREITGYFEREYRRGHNGEDFNGIKVLLADMSPARAKAFAANFREFHIVVSAADEDLETAGQKETIIRPTRARPKAFIAVPAGYYRTRTPGKPGIEIGKIALSIAADNSTLESVRLVSSPEEREGPRQDQNFPKWFNDQIQLAARKCFGGPPKPSSDENGSHSQSGEPKTAPLEMLKLQKLTLCAMQQELGADVALLQTRDFFGYLPIGKAAPPELQLSDSLREEQAQLLLDRIIWKGDFLSLVYVPGSALLKALEQSKKYKDDDGSALSLSDEHERDLLFVGIVQDKTRNEYLIDEAPVDKNRLYAVATSDYIAAGGTGYPDFAAAVIKPPQSPEDFPRQMQAISGLVCKRIYEGWPAPKSDKRSNWMRDYCRQPVDRKLYFDVIVMEPPDHGNRNIAAQAPKIIVQFDPASNGLDANPPSAISDQSEDGNQMALGQPLMPPVKSSKPGAKSQPSDDDLVQQRVQYRGLGSTRFNPPDSSLFAIDNASFSFSSLTHRFSDAQLKTAFPGSPLTQLTAVRSHTLQFDVKPRYTYSWHWGELFSMGEVRFNSQYTGQANASRLINQKENLLSLDTGFAGHVWSPGLSSSGKKHYPFGRSVPHFEPTLAIHYETQVLNPLPHFLESLATSQVVPGFEQSRTHLALVRTGGRYLWRSGWVEGGYEQGKEFNAIRLAPVPGSSLTDVLRPDVPVAGVYFNLHLVTPNPKTFSWQIDELGDYFFNKPSDNPIDTQFRSDIEMALNIRIWQSLSLSPTYEIFTYTNKIQGIWFWQGQASMKLRLRFDFWNHRDWWARQIRYSPSAN